MTVKRIMVLLLVCVMASGVFVTAQASKWGMSGEMHAFLEESGEYDDYTDIQSGYDRDADVFCFTASNGEKKQLTVVERNAKGKMEEVGRYPGAVFQPASGQNGDFWLGRVENGIRLKHMWYDFDVHLQFQWEAGDTVRDGADMLLRSAKNPNWMQFTLSEDRQSYTVDGSFGALTWQVPGISIEEFRIAMMPESMSEIMHRNDVRQVLGTTDVFSRRITVDIGKNKNLPVYAAPSQTAWRGADGKAALGLKEPFDVLARDGAWYLVEYDISPAKKRIGYVQLPENMALDVPEASRQGWTIITARETFLTDDPHGGAEAVTMLPKGARLTCYGCVDAFWVWVETSVNGERFRGFMPLADVQMEPASDRQMMEALAGTWRFIGGGELLNYGVVFAADGRMTLCGTEDEVHVPPETLTAVRECTYTVTPVTGEVRDYWGADHVLIVYRENEREERYGLTLVPGSETESGLDELTVTMEEAGGGYVRCDPGIVKNMY